MRSSISNQSNISSCDLFMYFFVEIIFWQCSVFVFCCDCFADFCFVCSPGTLSCNFAQSAECDRWLDLKLGAARELLGSKLAVCAVGPRGSRQRAVLCAMDQGLQPHETPEGVHLRELCTGHGSSSFIVNNARLAGSAGWLPLFVPSSQHLSPLIEMSLSCYNGWIFKSKYRIFANHCHDNHSFQGADPLSICT